MSYTSGNTFPHCKFMLGLCHGGVGSCHQASHFFWNVHIMTSPTHLESLKSELCSLRKVGLSHGFFAGLPMAGHTYHLAVCEWPDLTQAHMLCPWCLGQSCGTHSSSSNAPGLAPIRALPATNSPPFQKMNTLSLSLKNHGRPQKSHMDSKLTSEKFGTHVFKHDKIDGGIRFVRNPSPEAAVRFVRVCLVCH